MSGVENQDLLKKDAMKSIANKLKQEKKERRLGLEKEKIVSMQKSNTYEEMAKCIEECLVDFYKTVLEIVLGYLRKYKYDPEPRTIKPENHCHSIYHIIQLQDGRVGVLTLYSLFIWTSSFDSFEEFPMPDKHQVRTGDTISQLQDGRLAYSCDKLLHILDLSFKKINQTLVLDESISFIKQLANGLLIVCTNRLHIFKGLLDSTLTDNHGVFPYFSYSKIQMKEQKKIKENTFPKQDNIIFLMESPSLLNNKDDTNRLALLRNDDTIDMVDLSLGIYVETFTSADRFPEWLIPFRLKSTNLSAKIKIDDRDYLYMHPQLLLSKLGHVIACTFEAQITVEDPCLGTEIQMLQESIYMEAYREVFELADSRLITSEGAALKIWTPEIHLDLIENENI